MTDKKTDDEKPAEEKPARSSASKKPTTIPMHQPGTDKTWDASSAAEAAEMSVRGWRQDDPNQDLTNVPSGFSSPGKGTPTGGDPVTVVAD